MIKMIKFLSISVWYLVSVCFRLDCVFLKDVEFLVFNIFICECYFIWK